ncbi:dc7546b3-dad4-4515-9ba9-09e45fc5331b [Thermothielavioides terrestris]|uniref:Dc7546b3-dad4-4515-9ba9-09e45fc5331b n=1 Tax=Thermothielavioides terrestris TaxID=2587410 RepID=A0A3S4D793_9PEZI|nr:dc7546b3-dad4-4515-9ba9-09e45fc5331b [Thermothielavioides terrestris]
MLPTAPLQTGPSSLDPFTRTLPTGHIYIAHVDPRPAAFKRNIFAVPVLLNVAVAALFAWRVASVAPWYAALLSSTLLGAANETTVRAADLPWPALARAVARRALTFLLDFVLAVFVWPWPYEFAVGTRGRGSPLAWRWAVGFRDREVYEGNAEAKEAREAVLGRVRAATAPLLMQRKTGYLTMDGEWDLDWKAMVDATRLVDKKEIALEAFGTVALLHHERFGWLTIDLGMGGNAEQDERRRQVFAFRDALAALGKEDLFFRWIEMIQFETTQPGGFTAEKQVEAAKKVRDMFKSNGVDFDGLWKEAVGTEGLAGMP